MWRGAQTGLSTLHANEAYLQSAEKYDEWPITKWEGRGRARHWRQHCCISQESGTLRQWVSGSRA